MERATTRQNRAGGVHPCWHAACVVKGRRLAPRYARSVDQLVSLSQFTMSYGLQISASGVMTAMYRQDVFANNLANMDTAGFKPDVPSTRAREAVRQEDGVLSLPSNALLERLGAGTLLNPNRISFANGPLRDTGNPLDVALQGDGFFVVRAASDGGNDAVRLTRDGRFTRNSSGQLVMAAGGLPVLDDGGNPITLGPGKVTIAGDGTISQNNEPVAKLNLVQPVDPSQLRKQGHSLFEASSDVIGSLAPATGSLRQFAYEDSAADEVRSLMQMTSASREVDSNVAMIQQHDRMMDRAINVLGRVS
jgi:flagellar basal-body rod protein FlgG